MKHPAISRRFAAMWHICHRRGESRLQNIFGQDAVLFVARVLAFCTAIPFHEAAHAWVSDKLGDPTARNMGRLTLNPIKHLDLWGLLAMLTIGIGWAKPVSINPNYYKDRKKGMALSALAGPVSNLLLGYVNYIIYKTILFAGVSAWGQYGLPLWIEVVTTIFSYLALINVNLAVFNLIPIPPFDGSRVLGLILPEKQYFAIQKYEKYVMGALILLMFLIPRVTPYNPLGWLLGTANSGVMRFFNWSTGYLDLLFGVSFA